jgi:hypothetical protein
MEAHSMKRRTSAIACLAWALVSVLGIAGCSGTSTPQASTSGTSTPALGSPPSSAASSAQPGGGSSTTSTQDTERQVLDTYLGMQRAFDTASETADPTFPDLTRYASGSALQRLTSGLTSMRDTGLRGRGKTVFHPKVQELAPAKAPTQAKVVDCMDTRGTSVYKANGQPYQDTPGGWRLVNATVNRVGGTWKVTGVGIHEVGSCTG